LRKVLNLTNNFIKFKIDFDEFYDFHKKMKELNDQYFQAKKRNDFYSKQKYINPQMRSILLNWLLEVSSQLGFKRETYHLCVFLIDKFLMTSEDVKTDEFQLLGVVCLMISSKFEEIYIPRVEKFSQLTESSYSIEKIINWEQKVLIALDWRINYNTLSTWSNLYMLKWDEFISINNELIMKLFNKIQIPKFKTHSSNNYCLFRNHFQILDFSTLCYLTNSYNDRYLVLAVLYLNLGLYFKAFSINTVVEKFPLFLRELAYNNDFNQLIGEFFKEVDVYFADLFETIQYISNFFVLAFDYSDPVNHEEVGDQLTYEDFLQIQTFNPNFPTSLTFVLSKFQFNK